MNELCKAAIETMKNAYAPYSNFCVGAALLTKDGHIFTGCNIENASYSATICAERVAIGKAISEGFREFKAIAVVGGKDGSIQPTLTPCGICRQVLSEFCDGDLNVLLVQSESEYKECKLSELFPSAFGMSDIC